MTLRVHPFVQRNLLGLFVLSKPPGPVCVHCTCSVFALYLGMYCTDLFCGHTGLVQLLFVDLHGSRSGVELKGDSSQSGAVTTFCCSMQLQETCQHVNSDVMNQPTFLLFVCRAYDVYPNLDAAVWMPTRVLSD